MTQPKTVDEKVLEILRDCPETRHNDMLLFCRYYNRYTYLRAGDLPLSDLAYNYKGYGLPCFETIRRSRQRVAQFYQALAVDLNMGKEDYFARRDELIRTYKEQGRKGEIQTALKAMEKEWQAKAPTLPEELCYLYGTYLNDYLHDVELCQRFAKRSREKMAEIILEKTGMSAISSFHTVHNYIDTSEMILRKGAIAAHEGELVLIPVNMRDGSVLARGKGNPEWNYSAPHGAGRLMSRTKAKETLDMNEYRKTMEGVYTTSVNESTIDEAPMAYKSLADIIDIISDAVDVIEVLKPIYNFKAS